MDPTRRSFLRFLLSSPLLLSAHRVSAAESFAEDPSFPDAARELIRDASRAINVFDFQPVAQRNLSDGHYAFLLAGVDHEVTLRANRRGFDKFGLRPRRLVDVRTIDSDLELLGAKLSSPILLAPIGSQGAFHAEGELPVARAAREMDHQLILSTARLGPSTTSRARAEHHSGISSTRRGSDPSRPGSSTERRTPVARPSFSPWT